MRITLLSFLLLCAVGSSFAKRIPSDCTAPDSVVQKYKYDAARIVLDRILRTSSPYQDSIRIPKEMVDSVLHALIAVYNISSLERDTVIKLLDIHTRWNMDIDFFGIEVDPKYQWARNLRDSIIPTGNSTIDSLMNLYGMTVDTTSKRGIDFKFKDPLNMRALKRVMQKIPGVYFGLVDYFLCAPNIYEVRADSLITFVYEYGWGDDPSYCKNWRDWSFTVFPDCSVQFDSAREYHLMSIATRITTVNDIFFYPNPTSDKLTVELPVKTTLDIVDVEGKILLSTLCQQGNTEISVSALPKGIYFLRAMDKNGSMRSAKFIKE